MNEHESYCKKDARKAKSVSMTLEGMNLSAELFKKHFGINSLKIEKT